jgi:hypothetical protein
MRRRLFSLMTAVALFRVLLSCAPVQVEKRYIGVLLRQGGKTREGIYGIRGADTGKDAAHSSQKSRSVRMKREYTLQANFKKGGTMKGKNVFLLRCADGLDDGGVRHRGPEIRYGCGKEVHRHRPSRQKMEVLQICGDPYFKRVAGETEIWHYSCVEKNVTGIGVCTNIFGVGTQWRTAKQRMDVYFTDDVVSDLKTESSEDTKVHY